jgi:coniferyl-aldehyde dehydrogenase
MPITKPKPNATSADQPDQERFKQVLAAQRAAYLHDGAPSLAKRRSDLKKFKAALIARRRAIEEAINADVGNRSRHETAIMEVLGVVQGIDYLNRNLRRFMRPSRRHIALHQRSGSNHVEYQPLGVVGVISPWNYPVNLSLMPVVTAIAAGNRVMLKPSKFTPATNALLASMLREIFPEEQVTVVSGDGAAFSSLPFDHLVFTGSTAVGRAVMKAASENLIPVTLELGGKSPTIVTKGHVTDSTVSSIVFGKLLSGGQTCIAPDYALVHESDVDAFIENYDRLVKAAYPEGPTSKDYTSIVNDQQYSILTDLLDDARAQEARIIEVGHHPGEAALRPHTLPPSVALGVTDDMRIAHEEIFGPILPLFPYRDTDDAIDYINARPRPLALYYFGDDDADRRKVLDRTTSGNVTINGTIMHVGQDDLPFGGVGESGMGKCHGLEGFRTLSHPKGVAPFGKRADALLNFFSAERQSRTRSLESPPHRNGTRFHVDRSHSSDRRARRVRLRRENLRSEGRRPHVAVLLPLPVLPTVHGQAVHRRHPRPREECRGELRARHVRQPQAATPRLRPRTRLPGRVLRPRPLREMRQPRPWPVRRLRRAVHRDHRRIGRNGLHPQRQLRAPGGPATRAAACLLPAAGAGRRRRPGQAPLLRQQPAGDRPDDQPTPSPALTVARRLACGAQHSVRA